jgi:hypothetical protein
VGYNELRSFYVSKFRQNTKTRAHLMLDGFVQRTAVYLKTVSEAVLVSDAGWRTPRPCAATLTISNVVDMLQPKYIAMCLYKAQSV